MSKDPKSVEPNLDECFAVAFEAAILAGRLIRSTINDPKIKSQFMQTKLNATDIVTQIDKESEKIILGLINKSFPDHEIIAEESSNGKEKNTNKISMEKPVWCIDPIDGTTNFFHGLPFVAVCIGMRYKGNSILGIVLNPIINEMFYATKGNGSFILDTSELINNNNNNKNKEFKYNKNYLKNSQLIHTSNLQFINENDTEMIETFVKKESMNENSIEISIGLSKAVILTEMGYDRSNEWVSSVLKRLDILLLEEKVRAIRMLGSCALNMCSVAAGRAHIFFEGRNTKWGPKPWDFTAAEIIVLEAGGCVYLPDTILKISSKDGSEYSEPLPFDCTQGRVLCCNNISAVQACLDLKLYLPEESNDENKNENDVKNNDEVKE